MSSLGMLLFVLLAIPAQLEAQDIVTKACNRALYKNDCKTILASAPHKTDKKSVCIFALNLVSSTASEIAKELGSSTGLAAKDCKSVYGDALDSINEARAAAASGDFFEVNTKVTAAMNAADTCEDGFKETSTKSPLTALNTKFNMLCSTILAITNA